MRGTLPVKKAPIKSVSASAVSLERLLGLVRKNGQLVAILSTVTNDIPYFVPSAQLYPYAIAESPVGAINKKLYQKKQLLINAWENLARVNQLNDDTLVNVMIVLLETQLVSRPGVSEPILPDFDRYENPTVKATAAHPRAYKGTKKKPLKGVKVEHNLQSLLMSERGTNYLLGELENYKQEALLRMRNLGYAESFIESLPTAQLSRSIRQCVRNYPLAEINRLLTPDLEPEIRAALARLAAFQPAGTLQDWFHLILLRPPDQRMRIILNLIMTRSLSQKVETIQYNFDQLDLLTDDSDIFIDALWTILDAVQNGHDLQYVLSGFRLLSHIGKAPSLGRIESSIQDFDLQTTLNIHDEILSLDHSGFMSSINIWRYCGSTPYLNKILPQLLASGLSATILSEFMFFLRFDNHFNTDAQSVVTAKRKIIAAHADVLLKTITQIAEPYQMRCVTEIKEFFLLPDRAETVNKNIDGFVILLPRICAPPFATKLDLSGTACGLIENHGIKILNDATDSSLLILESQSKQGSVQALVTNSLCWLNEAVPDFTARCFASETTKLCNIARLFGTLPLEQKTKTLLDFKKHTLMQNLNDLEIRDLFDQIKPFISQSISSPFPAKVAANLAGKLTLTTEQLRRGHKVALSNLDATRLDLLKQMIFGHLKEEIPTTQLSDKTVHAVQLYNRSTRNRRAFKSFLKAYWNGRENYREDHPLSIKWLAKHPKLNRKIFHQGIVLHRPLKQVGTLTLAVENDPFEALKLGTYVNSCLSVNGICNDSSMAVILDINKRVVYARDEKGKVIGRQIIAWNEADQLTCFGVYPSNASHALKLIFREYDEVFAEALGVAIYKRDCNSDEEEPDIINILSTSWWDDGTWDFSDLDDDDLIDRDSTTEERQQ